MLFASCLSYTKFEIIQLPVEEFAAKSSVSRKMLLKVLRVLTLPLQLLTNSFQSVSSIDGV